MGITAAWAADPAVPEAPKLLRFGGIGKGLMKAIKQGL
jgi:hypothetical protein